MRHVFIFFHPLKSIISSIDFHEVDSYKEKENFRNDSENYCHHIYLPDISWKKGGAKGQCPDKDSLSLDKMPFSWRVFFSWELTEILTTYRR